MSIVSYGNLDKLSKDYLIFNNVTLRRSKIGEMPCKPKAEEIVIHIMTFTNDLRVPIANCVRKFLLGFIPFSLLPQVGKRC